MEPAHDVRRSRQRDGKLIPQKSFTPSAATNSTPVGTEALYDIYARENAGRRAGATAVLQHNHTVGPR